MLQILVVGLVLFASNPGQCWSDSRFSMVRQLSAKQYQNGNKLLAQEAEANAPDVKSQARSSRPLFNWDFIIPSQRSSKPLTLSQGLRSNESSTSSPFKDRAYLGKGRRKKKKHTRKHTDSKIKREFFNNPTTTTNSHSNNGTSGNYEMLIHETNNSQAINYEKMGNFDRIRQSFRLKQQKKQRKKNRKDRTGKRKQKSDGRKGEKGMKREYRKHNRRGRKQKYNYVISNSIPPLVNDNFRGHKPVKAYEFIDPLQESGKMLTENQIEYRKKLTESKNHNITKIVHSEVNNTGKSISSSRDINVAEMLETSEHEVKDNLLIPKLCAKNVDGSDYSLRKCSNTTSRTVSKSILEENKGNVEHNEIKDGNSIVEDFSNRSISTQFDINIHHREAYETNKRLHDSDANLVTLERFNELRDHEEYSSESNFSDVHHNAQLERELFNSINTKQNISGDLTCLTGPFLPAPAMPGARIKYIRIENTTPYQNSVNLIAEYGCNSQYHLQNVSNNQLTCYQRQWVGEQPACLPNEEVHLNRTHCGETKRECDHICEIISGATVCSCYRGFHLHLHGNTCQDINECKYSNGGCESGCRNTLGSYHCVCPKGLRLADDDKSCLDVNECLLRNGHGPCQDSCHNLWAGYECSCEGIPGTKLSVDNHTCQDVDECADGTAGCSHTCLNTLGSAFCLCPAGFMLGEDWKTCQDINECAYEDLQTEHCELGCVNTIGSYYCLEKEENTKGKQETVLCPQGMRQDSDGNCEDVDECDENISGCTQSCLNTNGSFQCICGLGFSLSSDNKTCIDGAEEAVCPPLESPVYGYLECTRHLVRISKSRYPWLKRARVVNHAGSVCQLKCPHGYILEGEYYKTCGQDMTWTGPENGSCILLPAPSITCPSNMTVAMSPGKSLVYVAIQQPITNVNWIRYVEAVPHWGKSLQANLQAGKWEVKFTAMHPTSRLTASCVLTINVI